MTRTTSDEVLEALERACSRRAGESRRLDDSTVETPKRRSRVTGIAVIGGLVGVGGVVAVALLVYS